MSLNLISKLLVAACASALAGIGTAALAGHVAPWWLAIVIGAVGAAAGVIMQSPVDHQAIAERKANTPPEALLILVFLAAYLVSACAHVQNVAASCEGTITADLRAQVTAALDRDEYAGALEAAAVGVLPCVFVATVKEVREASAQASGSGPGEPKAMMRLDLLVRVRRADTWLAAHGGHAFNFLLDGRRERGHLRLAMMTQRTWSITQSGHSAPAALPCVRMDSNATRAQVSGGYSQKLETKREAAIG